MRSVWRTAGRGLLRDIAALAVAALAIGVSFGAIAVAAGVPGWLAVTMSLLVFAGGSQFLAVGLLAAGSPAGALLGGLLLNARHLPFGLALAERGGDDEPNRPVPRQSDGTSQAATPAVIGTGWLSRLVGSHLLIDESVAFALAQADPRQRRAAFWLTGLALFTVWNLGTLAGVVLGGAVADPAALGLDAAFPAGLLALLWPSLRDPAARRVATVGVAVALLTTPVLPAGMPVLLALTGLVAVKLPLPRRRTQPEVRR
ncbi:AzlC family ABC transporter permease [Natronosporangium hydrolyticum]|uniref:AzlC family ABC transporter permease n=1 Tax=Natronosporangium hydrolyticum TaxID=2811111 RepID=A0A895Y730_9ACTN|nr:AzlC family ABC transporter permease [Natronosporangium hydrolyticum]QSB13537.1 AzlC family ABC transporter permease [Natronosporangium hydrolyticum]